MTSERNNAMTSQNNMNNPLIVPIHVEALCIGSADAKKQNGVYVKKDCMKALASKGFIRYAGRRGITLRLPKPQSDPQVESNQGQEDQQNQQVSDQVQTTTSAIKQSDESRLSEPSPGTSTQEELEVESDLTNQPPSTQHADKSNISLENDQLTNKSIN